MKKRVLPFVLVAVCYSSITIGYTSLDLPKASSVSVQIPPISKNDILWEIAGKVLPSGKITRSQAMTAILRRNPDAFLNGNINQLKVGVILTLPTLAEMEAEPNELADEMVSKHDQAWRKKIAATPMLYPLPQQQTPSDDHQITTPVAALKEEKPLATPAPADVVEPQLDGRSKQMSDTNQYQQDIQKPIESDKITQEKTVADLSVSVIARGLLLLILIIASILLLWRYFNTRSKRRSPIFIPKESFKPVDINQILPDLESVSELVAKDGLARLTSHPMDPVEANIKLMIGQAYVDLEHFDRARDIFLEVIQEGNRALQKQASQLLSELPT